jgi:ATP-dependent Clp protease ATP-binding subunit ClpA
MQVIAQDLKQSIVSAFWYTQQLRHEFVTVEHLLLILLHNPKVETVLRNYMTDSSGLKHKLKNYIERDISPVSGDGEVEVKSSTGLQRVIERAIVCARRSTGKTIEVTGAHALMAIYGESNSPTALFLQELNLTVREISAFVENGSRHT